MGLISTKCLSLVCFTYHLKLSNVSLAVLKMAYCQMSIKHYFGFHVNLQSHIWIPSIGFFDERGEEIVQGKYGSPLLKYPYLNPHP